MDTLGKRWRRVAASGLAATLLMGCGPGSQGVAVDGDAESAPKESGSPAAAPGPLTAADLAGVGSCEALHDRVLARIDQEAEFARAATDLDPREALGREDVPEALAPVLRLHPPRPYGGLGGDDVEDRYGELGCGPDDEFPALLAWFGLPPDTARDLEGDTLLAAALTQRLEADGSGGFAALGLARRLGEGGETDDGALFAALRQVAAAQEAYRGEHATYADTLAALVPYGLDEALAGPDPDVSLAVTAADEDAYCVHGADRGSAVLESHDGEPRNRAPGSPSCPNTFPDLDG